MKILIDTHVVIWFIEGNSFLSTKARNLIIDGNNDVFVSLVSY